MGWPTPQDYNEAVQNPSLNFRDPSLKAGKPELNSLGIPNPRSGSFATVYRLDCGARRFAVKCFTKPVADQEARYKAIGSHLKAANLSYTVGFDFLAEGVRVGGRWYPVLKMEWLDGQRLNTYIESNLANRRRLHDLIPRWCELTKALTQASIAHGDLQHGNILVVDGALRLIDYDGMWVPALAGLQSNELGEPNYQSPQRGPTDFGPYLDNFSTWVIGISLYALATDPSLWTRFNGGDKCLLFRKTDFEHPEASALLKALCSSTIADLGVVTGLFESLLYLPLRDVPTLDGSTLAAGLPEVSAPVLPAWIADHVTIAKPSSAPPAIQRPAPLVKPDPSWILELAGIGQSTPLPQFVESVIPERVLLFLGGLLIALVFVLRPPAVSPLLAWLLLATANLILARIRYRREPVVKEIDSILASAKEIAQKIVSADRDIGAVRQALKQRRESDTAFLARLVERRRALEREEAAKDATVRNALIAALQRTNQKRQVIIDAENSALRSLGAGPRFGAIANLKIKLNELTAAQRNELVRALQAKQQRYLLAALGSYSVMAVQLGAVGDTFKARLVAAGVRTAADVSAHVRSIPGIGAKRMRSLLEWRASLERVASARMPNALDPTDIARIQSKYADRIEDARRQLPDLEASLTADEGAIRARHAIQRPPLDEEERRAKAIASEERGRIKAEYGQHYLILTENEQRHREEPRGASELLDARGTELQKKAFGLHFQRVKLQSQLYRYECVNFKSYVRRVAGLG